MHPDAYEMIRLVKDQGWRLTVLSHLVAADQVEQLAYLGRRLPDKANSGRDVHGVWVRLADRSPEWPRNVRVGANSPKRCPTIDSVM